MKVEIRMGLRCRSRNVAMNDLVAYNYRIEGFNTRHPPALWLTVGLFYET